MTRANHVLPFGLIATLAGALTTGCAALTPQESPRLTAEVVPGAAGQAATQQAGFANSYTVEIRNSKGQSQSKHQELSGPLHVQEALEGTKANKKFRRFFVRLNRPLPDGRMHNMDLAYDRGAKRLEPEFDYAILPGDRIIVIEDNTTVIDDVMDMLNGPLGGGGFTGMGSKPQSGKYKYVGP
jgi:hypothetical protein